MPIVIKENQEPAVSPGTYLARCFRIVDAGTQQSEIYEDKHKLIITWELPTERITVEDKDLPRAVSKFYTFSLNSKSVLRKDLEAWRGRPFTPEELGGFQLAKILGTPCQITVGLSKTGKAKVEAVVGIPRGTMVPKLENPMVEYGFEEGTGGAWKDLPEWLQKTVGSCVEWSKPTPVDPPASHVEDDPEDDCPF